MAMDKDLSERILKKIKEDFTTRVVPSQLLPYLTCLSFADEQEIRNAEKQKSDCFAAQELLQKLYRCQGWFDELVDGLEKLEFFDIVKKLKEARCDLTVRVTLENPSASGQMVPEPLYGQRCVGGNCSPGEPPFDEGKGLDLEMTRLTLKSERLEVEEREVKIQKQKLENQEKSLNLLLFHKIADAFIDECITEKNFDMEMINKKLALLKENLFITRKEHGSIIFVFKAQTLPDLDMFEKLLSGGGLKDLLTRQILNAEGLRNLESIAQTHGYEGSMSDCQLHIEVDSAEVLLCRSWLIEQKVTIPPTTWRESLINFGKNVPEESILDTLMAYKTLLPLWFWNMLEDPLLQNELHNLVTGGILKKEIREDQLIKWVVCKLETYFNKFSDDEKIDLIKLAWVGYGNVQEKSSFCISSSDDGSDIIVEEYVQRYLTSRMSTDLKLKHKIEFFLKKNILKHHDHAPSSYVFQSQLFIQYIITHKCFENMKLPRDLKAFCRIVNDIERVSYIAPLLSLLPQQFAHIKNIFSKAEAFDFCHIQLPIAIENRDFVMVKFCQDILGGTNTEDSMFMSRDFPPQHIAQILRAIGDEISDSYVTEETLTGTLDVSISAEQPLYFNVNVQDILTLLKTDLSRYVRLLHYFTKIVQSVALFLTSGPIKFDSNVDIKTLEQILSESFKNFKLFSNDLVVKEIEIKGLMEFLCQVYSISNFVRVQSYKLHVNDEGYIHINLQLACLEKIGYCGALLNSIDMSHMELGEEEEDLISRVTNFPPAKKFIVNNSSAHLSALQSLLKEISLKKQDLYLTHLSMIGLVLPSGSFASGLGLNQLSNIVTLNMEGICLGDAGICSLSREMSCLTKLREINVANNNITSQGMYTFCMNLSDNKFLTVVRVQSNQFGSEGAIYLSFLIHKCSFLEVLNVYQCNIGSSGALHIARALSDKKHLKRISFRENDIKSDGSKALFDALRDSSSLKFLDYGNNSIDSEACDSLSTLLSKCDFVDYISLWHCGLGDAGKFGGASKFKKFPLTQNMSHLQQICLQENSFSDSDATYVARYLIGPWRYVRSLTLCDNRISDTGAHELAKVLAKGHEYLEVLNLSRNDLGLFGVEDLLNALMKDNCPALKVLDLSYNSNTTQEDITEFLLRRELKFEVAKDQTDLKEISYKNVKVQL